MSRELLKRLRNALNISADDFNELMDDLDAELAKPEPEPVAWMRHCKFYGCLEFTSKDDPAAFPVYTSPPARKPLSNEELIEIYMKAKQSPFLDEALVYFGGAVEKAHGIGVE